MNIFLDFSNSTINSGASGFALKLTNGLGELGHKVVKNISQADIQLCFAIKRKKHNIPFVQRIDGIHFNSICNYEAANIELKKTYKSANAVIIQSNFDYKLINGFFGERINCFVIHNGTDFKIIDSISPSTYSKLNHYDNIWACAALSWDKRPNKRLKDNIRYFNNNAGNNDCLVICGDTKIKLNSNRIFNLGILKWEDMISVFKRAKFFIHLAIVDHCPNVVVDARACGCEIICSSLAGTEEVAGHNCIVVEDKKWDFKTPFNYKQPPSLNFNNIRKGNYDVDININSISKQYLNVFQKVLKNV